MKVLLLHQLRDSFETVQGEVEGYRSTAESALRKEQKATHMVAELTAIVREQRGRLSELARSKQESTRELKVRRMKEKGHGLGGLNRRE